MLKVAANLTSTLPIYSGYVNFREIKKGSQQGILLYRVAVFTLSIFGLRSIISVRSDQFCFEGDLVTQNEVFENLKNYFETRPAPRWALGFLKPGTEIGLVIGKQIECAIFNRGGIPTVEKREAQSPNFIFHMKPETIEILANSKSDDVAEIGMNIFTEIITGDIRVEMKGSMKEIMNAGYLDILKAGGQKFTDFLSTQSSMGLMKVLSFIDKIKNSRSL